MGFNELLVEIGEFGLYQKLLTFAFMIQMMCMVACTYWTQIFILIIPPHRCKISAMDNAWLNIDESESYYNRSQCFLSDSNNTMEQDITCTYGMLYDFSVNFPTYVSENDWVCENSWKMYLAHSCYWFGALSSAIVFGILSDKYGRKRALQMAVFLTLGSDVATLFCSNQYIFMIARFGSGLGVGNIAVISFVLAVEYTGPSKRALSLFVLGFSYAIMAAIYPWIAYFIQNWRYILMISWIPSVAVIAATFLVSESASWLMAVGRIEDAVSTVQRVAKINGTKVSKDYIRAKLLEKDTNEIIKVKENDASIDSKNNAYKELSFLEAISAILKSPTLRKKLLFFTIIWMVAAACYNGMNLQSSNLPFNLYVAYSVGALIETPGNVFCILTIDKFGRRWTNFGILITSGILGIISINLTTPTYILVFALLMRCCYSSAFDITFTFASESFPTVIRGRAIAITRAFGFSGSLLAPFIVKLGEKNILLPLFIFGMIAITAGILTLFLPETANQHLPHTIEESIHFGKDQSFWFCPLKKQNCEENIHHQQNSSEIVKNNSINCNTLNTEEKY